MILQSGEETGDGCQGDARRRALHAAFPSPTSLLAFHDSAQPSRGSHRRRPRATRSRTSIREHRPCKGVGGHGAYPQTTKDPIVLASPHRDGAADPRQPREQSARPRGGDGRQLPCRDQEQHHPRRGQAPLTVRSYTPEARKLLLDGIAADRARRGDRRRHSRRPHAHGGRSRQPYTPTRPSTPSRCRII